MRIGLALPAGLDQAPPQVARTGADRGPGVPGSRSRDLQEGLRFVQT
jgi:hypothetical protein